MPAAVECLTVLLVLTMKLFMSLLITIIMKREQERHPTGGIGVGAGGSEKGH